MSEPMKKPLIDTFTVTVRSKKTRRQFLLPKSKVQGLICLMERFEVHDKNKLETEDLFSDLNKKYTKPGAILKGARLKENLSQKKIADKLKISQSHISEMEHGKRPIGKRMSQRLSKILKVSYKIFL